MQHNAAFQQGLHCLLKLKQPCVCHAFASVNSCLMVTSRENLYLLARVCDVYCEFITFPFGILGQVWYLIVSIPDPCCLSYFNVQNFTIIEKILHGSPQDAKWRNHYLLYQYVWENLPEYKVSTCKCYTLDL